MSLPVALNVLGPVVNAAGADPQTGTLTCRFPAQQRDLLIYRLTIDGPADTIARVFRTAAVPGNKIDTSYYGDEDSADFPQGVFMAAGVELIVCWYLLVTAAGTLTGATIANITTAAQGAATAVADFGYAQ